MNKKQYPKNRYLLMGMNGCYPVGGFGDLMFGFDNTKQMRDKLNSARKAKGPYGTEVYQHYQVVDTKELVFYNINGEYKLLMEIDKIVGTNLGQSRSFTSQ